MSDLMVVKVINGVNINPELMKHLQKDIIKQKETGVVILPWFLTTVVVPEDTEIRIESEGNNDTNSTADL